MNAPSFQGPVLVRGAGEHASGTAHRLVRAGFRVVMTEIPRPLAVRLAVSFARAVYEGVAEVEGVTARRVDAVPGDWDGSWIPVIVDPDGHAGAALSPGVLVDARLKKRDIETRITDAPLVIGLGPGFRAGIHCHAVVETNRGHDLGRVITEGEAEPDTGTPGLIAGFASERVIRAPIDGRFDASCRIGDEVKAGATIGTVAGREVVASIDGILRGVLRSGLDVSAGTKLGDVDPRARRSHCFTLTDKTRAISGGVLECILARRAGRL